MNSKHLSGWQMEELIISGERRGGRQVWSHIESCALCRSEKDRLEALVELYRQSALLVTEEQSMAAPSSAHSSVRSKTKILSWSVARWALALLLLIGTLIPLLLFHQSKRREAAEMARDNQLLEQVDQEVTESVPQPLESLTHLIVASGTTQQ
jgi:hypothetical protein